jgi:hypothetical protein
MEQMMNKNWHYLVMVGIPFLLVKQIQLIRQQQMELNISLELLWQLVQLGYIQHYINLLFIYHRLVVLVVL